VGKKMLLIIIKHSNCIQDLA